MIALLGWLCYVAAAIFAFILVFSSVLDPSWIYCVFGLVASGLALHSLPPVSVAPRRPASDA